MTTNNPDTEAILAAIRKAAAAVARAEQALNQRRTELSDWIGVGAEARIKPAELVQASGKSAETIRQISRERGVEPLRPPTSGGFKKVSPSKSGKS